VAKGSPDYVSCRDNLTRVRANSAAAANARAMTATGAANAGSPHY